MEGCGGTELVTHPVVPFPPALRDNRIQLERSTPNELTISISDVVLSDEGEYTCSIFTMPVRTAKALVTVLGKPLVAAPPPAPDLLPATALPARCCPCSHSSLLLPYPYLLTHPCCVY